MKTYIEVKNEIDLVHCYPAAPKEVEFLKNAHRHTFKISTRVQVFHDDREIEFYMLRDYLKRCFERDTFVDSISCEQLAKFAIEKVESKYGNKRRIIVSVFEDGINGAIVDTEDR